MHLSICWHQDIMATHGQVSRKLKYHVNDYFLVIARLYHLLYFQRYLRLQSLHSTKSGSIKFVNHLWLPETE